jgi:Fic family protein
MGRVRAAAIAVTFEAMGQADVWPKAPLQVMAHLHAVASHGFSADVGRPRTTDEADDPMHIGMAPPASMVSPRLTLLSDVVTGPTMPAVFEAALVHGELMALRPFAWGNGLVARAMVRTIFSARGVDPSMFSIPELGMFEAGRSSYVSAIRQFQAGRIEGMRAYVEWFCAAVQRGTLIR